MLFITNVAASGTKMPVGDAAIAAVLGYATVFLGLAMLLCVVYFAGKIMVARTKKAEAVAEAPAVPDKVMAPQAPGTAGDVKLYDTDPRDAALIMAIVADKMGKPLNELRFISIKEVK